MSDPCVNLPTLETWIRGGTSAECRPCKLAFLTPWYRDLLKDNGLPDEAQVVEQMHETDDPVQVARALDAVKKRVPPELTAKLREYDCAVQRAEEEEP